MNEEYGNKCTLLYYAVLSKLVKLIIKLCDKRANLHVLNIWGKEPSDYASEFGLQCKIKRTENKEYPFFDPNEIESILNNWCRKRCDPSLECKSRLYIYSLCSQEELDWIKDSCSYLISDNYISMQVQKIKI